jgi:DNA sulfur modification protein DndD
MKLLKLTLQDFGVYRGHVELHLDNRKANGSSKPVILMGGTNGAGKTTILEALRLCLYGRYAVDSKITQAKYEEYLRGKVHRNEDATLNPYIAAVSVEFEHTEQQQVNTYTVKRKWDISSDKVKTILTIEKDGVPFDDIDHENANQFLRDLIPPGVSQLYFFDGEKIQHLAESNDDAALADAIKKLLGLELVDQLSKDLKVYDIRLTAEEGGADIAENYDRILARLSDLDCSRMDQRIACDNAASKRDELHKAIHIAETKLASEGGNYAEKRGQFQSDILTHSHRKSAIEELIREEAEQLLPFTLVPERCEELSQQLLKEDKRLRWENAGEILAEQLSTCSSAIAKEISEITESPTKTKEIKACVKRSLEKTCDIPTDVQEVNIVHRLSDSQKQTISSGLLFAGQLPEQLRKLENELVRESELLASAELALAKAPDDDQLKALTEELGKLNKELGRQERQVEQAEQSSNELEIQHADASRALEKIGLEQRQRTKWTEKQLLIERVQTVLSRYQKSLLESKTKALGKAICKRLGQLWRKGDKAKSVDICPETFNVTIYRKNGKVLPKTELSAGEKQMYAVAVLWGLADVSGRPLPLVIDTPLGRLDKTHRRRLVEEYFPTASHQVIILSTDTEIGDELLGMLKPNISHTISIDHDSDNEFTTLSAGYFGEAIMEEVHDAA